ncbi:MAG: hypothetical protein ACBZ72_08570 [Candidatus Bathyarchaeia archaeon]
MEKLPMEGGNYTRVVVAPTIRQLNSTMATKLREVLPAPFDHRNKPPAFTVSHVNWQNGNAVHQRLCRAGLFQDGVYSIR